MREREQLIDQTLHALRLFVDDAQSFASLFRQAGVVKRGRRFGSDHGKRRAQIVRCIVRELALQRDRLFQRAERSLGEQKCSAGNERQSDDVRDEQEHRVLEHHRARDFGHAGPVADRLHVLPDDE
jgi:hypothetical protein